LTTSKDVNRTDAVSKSKVVLPDIALDSPMAYKRFMNQTSPEKIVHTTRKQISIIHKMCFSWQCK